jgi:hypothetical protein
MEYIKVAPSRQRNLFLFIIVMPQQQLHVRFGEVQLDGERSERTRNDNRDSQVGENKVRVVLVVKRMRSTDYGIGRRSSGA